MPRVAAQEQFVVSSILTASSHSDGARRKRPAPRAAAQERSGSSAASARKRRRSTESEKIRDAAARRSLGERAPGPRADTPAAFGRNRSSAVPPDARARTCSSPASASYRNGGRSYQPCERTTVSKENGAAAATAITAKSVRTSLVSPRLDRIQPRSLHGRVRADEDPDAHRNDEPHDDRPHRHGGGKRDRQRPDERREPAADENPDHAAERRERDRLGQELADDVPPE